MSNEPSIPFVLALDDASATLELVVAKGASLARMAAADLPVPPGFHVTTAAYRRFVTENGLQDKILAAVSMVSAGDPAALEEACQTVSGLIPCKVAYEAAQGADALILMTEWNQFRTLDFDRLKQVVRQPIFFDLRNVYDPERVVAFGFRHISVGRPSKAPS